MWKFSLQSWEFKGALHNATFPWGLILDNSYPQFWPYCLGGWPLDSHDIPWHKKIQKEKKKKNESDYAGVIMHYSLRKSLNLTYICIVWSPTNRVPFNDPCHNKSPEFGGVFQTQIPFQPEAPSPYAVRFPSHFQEFYVDQTVQGPTKISHKVPKTEMLKCFKKTNW